MQNFLFYWNGTINIIPTISKMNSGFKTVEKTILKYFNISQTYSTFNKSNNNVFEFANRDKNS